VRRDTATGSGAVIVNISSDAEENDILEGFQFYEEQAEGLGSYFRDCIISDIESLQFYGGIHEVSYGYRRMLAKRFPFAIYYTLDGDKVFVIAVLDERRDPHWIQERLNRG
jgi:plasmid stabilization system protein ParE